MAMNMAWPSVEKRGLIVDAYRAPRQRHSAPVAGGASPLGLDRLPAAKRRPRVQYAVSIDDGRGRRLSPDNTVRPSPALAFAPRSPYIARYLIFTGFIHAIRQYRHPGRS
ncbi:hypothetical protein ACS8YF_04235 [Salinisphaera sp. SWV1]|uniref:hypothetical protein n=1 Tax=Salinisphaera sp. SWV1 TaxID=3454139 RepID=UPI003F82B349